MQQAMPLIKEGYLLPGLIDGKESRGSSGGWALRFFRQRRAG
jgi:hypothetical protein